MIGTRVASSLILGGYRGYLDVVWLGADLRPMVHAAMEAPGCRLRLYWRSFWASCGDKQRFEWRDAPQARDVASLGEEALRKMGLPSRLRVVKG